VAGSGNRQQTLHGSPTPPRERRRAPIAHARFACLAASGEAVALDDRTGPRAVGASADARDRRPVQRHDLQVYARHERATVAACPQRRRRAAAWRPHVYRVADVPNAPTRVHANANPASRGGTQDQAEVAGVCPSAIAALGFCPLRRICDAGNVPVGTIPGVTHIRTRRTSSVARTRVQPANCEVQGRPTARICTLRLEPDRGPFPAGQSRCGC
jgi:hypothetical protein